MKKLFYKHKKGFSLVEILVSIAIFAILSITVYEMVTTILRGISSYRQNIVASTLANQYMEIVRNMPYSEIGSISGNPSGNLADLPNAIETTINDVLYKIYYVVSYVDDPSDGTIMNSTDISPNDYKQVKMYVLNTKTNITSSFLTNVAPKNLEGLIDSGAIYIKVFDAIGQPVSNATIHITNTIKNLDIIRTTNSNGEWIEVGLSTSSNSYHIVVTKNGYSQDQTYPITTENPNPTKPDSTVSNGEVTKISFSIDKLSDLTINSLNQYCSPISNVGMEIRGSKLIGLSPEIYKFDNLYSSNSQGKIILQDIEWDNYTPALTSNYTILGSYPIQNVGVLPNTEQNFTFILGPKTSNNILVIVKDSSTNNSIEGARVELSSASKQYYSSKITGGSVWSQTSWIGGDNQTNWVDETKYYESISIDTNDILEILKLKSYDGGNNYFNSGYLVSSSFDTGSTSTIFTNIEWQPESQNASTTVRLQIATNNDNSTWNFVGPDGTPDSYYTVSGTNINSTSKRYIKYKIFLDTTDTSITPVITNIRINYVSGCFTPGQTIFTNLSTSNDYLIKITKDGYKEATSTLVISESNDLYIYLEK